MRFPRPTVSRPRTARAGFTLIELMITLVLLAIVVAVIATVMIGSERSKADTEGRVEAQQSGRAISDLIAQDLRTAGYDTDVDAVPPQPPFAYVDSVEIMINTNLNTGAISYLDTLASGRFYPRSINPGQTPIPPRMTGGYIPPISYATGAETIRYTLDINNDGVVNASDQTQPLAQEAQRTANPNDYVLARGVYGLQDPALGPGNGGSLQKIGLVRGPGAGIPPLFTVYLGSNPLPWNWHNGAIPTSELKNISRITLRVTTEGRRAFKDGTYPRSTLTTEVNSLRNAPGARATVYSVSGYVFKDTNKNGTRDTGEPGVSGALLRLGTASVSQSSSTGSYLVSAAPAAYVLHQTPPSGYGAFGTDSLAVDFVNNPVDVTYNFADTTLSGGWLADTCYVDENSNNVFDVNDTPVDGVRVAVGTNSTLTDGDGAASLFLSPGTQSVSFTAPDSFMVISANPASISMTNGATVTLYTKLVKTGTGTVTGYVYLDTNKNGTMDTGEAGIKNVWVGVTKDGGLTFLGYAYTDVNGLYSIIVSNNMPAATDPYTVTVIPPPGYYPTGTTALSPVWVALGQTVSGKNFGMVNFTSISLTADRVLALGTAVLMPFDWTGNASQWASKAGFRKDLILCSEYASAPNISVWYNHEPTAPVFDTGFTYQRNALSSALSIASASIDTLTSGSNVVAREDIVTGLAKKVTGNIAVWLTQNGTGNEGQLVSSVSIPAGPTLYQTLDAGDVNQVLLTDCSGGTAPDLIVGTRTSNFVGTMEVWRGSGTGTFARDEVYPNAGNLPGNTLGEVKAMMLQDVNSDGIADLIVGTKTGDGQGSLHILGFNSKTPNNRYRTINTYSIIGEVTALTACDVNADGIMDIIVGTRISSVAGDIQWWRGSGSGNFTLVQTFAAPGPVLCLTAADLGAAARNDIIFGFRDNESGFSGGVRILYTDLGVLPFAAIDPAGGTSSYMTTSVISANFNYRLNNTTPGPYYADLAVAQKPTATTGNLLVFIR
jgi:prepilin-type N-terminal cleavage/methylation domain-containing protein